MNERPVYADGTASLVAPSCIESDDLYDALAASERRRVLFSLLARETAPIDELADLLAGWRAAADGRTIDAEERDRILLSLVHAHVPKLARANLVDYDEAADRIALAVDREFLRRVLVVDPEPDSVPAEFVERFAE